MGQGKEGEPYVPVEARTGVLGGPEVGAEVAVAEHHSLGAACGAGGVDDGGQVIGLYLLFGGQGGGAGRARFSLDYGEIVQADDHFQPVDGLGQDLRQQFAGDEEGLGGGMFEDVLDLAFGKIGQHRQGYPPEGRGGEIGYTPVWHVLAQEADHVVPAEPVAGEQFSYLIDFGVKLRVCVARPVYEMQEGLVSVSGK